ncbi:MAG: DUF1934 domain-containing protein [Lachnospiraceae bacterium]|nr:DUF1934 domain-containing protein [Lachnospiraceae bacterium]
MTKEVMVKITGSEYGVSEQEQVEQRIKGNYYQKNGRDFVVYDVAEGEENVHTMLKIEGEQLEITKNSGAGRLHMKFKQGETFSTMYHTMAGALEMEFHTNELVIFSNENWIRIEALYEISINKAEVGARRIQIEIEKITK